MVLMPTEQPAPAACRGASRGEDRANLKEVMDELKLPRTTWPDHPHRRYGARRGRAAVGPRLPAGWWKAIRGCTVVPRRSRSTRNPLIIRALRDYLRTTSARILIDHEDLYNDARD